MGIGKAVWIAKTLAGIASDGSVPFDRLPTFAKKYAISPAINRCNSFLGNSGQQIDKVRVGAASGKV